MHTYSVINTASARIFSSIPAVYTYVRQCRHDASPRATDGEIGVKIENSKWRASKEMLKSIGEVTVILKNYTKISIPLAGILENLFLFDNSIFINIVNYSWFL